MAEQAQQRHDIEHTVDPTTDLDDLDRWEGRYYQLAYPWESNIPSVTMSLGRYVQGGLVLARSLRGSMKAGWSFVRYMLAGREETESRDDPFNQIRVDVESTPEPLVADEVEMSLDFDSLISVVSTVVMNETHRLSIFSIAPFRDTHTKDNHLRTTITHNGAATTVPTHHIPNFALGEVGHRGKVVVLLPALYRREQVDRRVPKELLEIFYNQIMRPALLDIEPRNDLPPNYAAAERLAQAINNGQYHYGTYDLAGDKVESLCHRIAAHAVRYGAFAGLVYMIEFRGEKGLTRYTVNRNTRPEIQQELRTRALASILAPLDNEMVAKSPVWIDLAVEFTVPNKTPRALKSGFAQILCWVFPEMTLGDATQLTQHSQFEVDTYLQLYNLAGFRFNIQSQNAHFHGAEYLQLYFPDAKSFTSSLGFKNLWSERATNTTLPKGLPILRRHLAEMSNLLQQAVENPATVMDNNEERITGAVRVKVRIPWNEYQSVMVGRPDNDTLRSLIIAYNPKVIWGYLWLRVTAIWVVVDMLAQCELKYRADEATGALCAVIIFMLNSMFRRESTHRNMVHLRDSAGRHVYEEDDPMGLNENSPSVAVEERHGAYFLADVLIRDDEGNGRDRAPQLPYTSMREIGRDVWLSLLGVSSYSNFQAFFPGVGRPAARQRNPTRTKNRSQGQTIDVDIGEGHRPRAEPRGIRLPDVILGVRRQHANTQPGLGGAPALQRQVDWHNQDVEAAAEEPAASVVEHILRQMPVDVIGCAANGYNAVLGSHVLLDQSLRGEQTLELFQSLDLRGVFDKARVLYMDQRQWQQQFDRYFPRKGWVQPVTLMHFPGLRYFNKWNNFLANNLNVLHAEQVRKEVKKVFDTLLWVPAAESDRLWTTRARPIGCKKAFAVPPNLQGPAVQIAVNLQHKPVISDFIFGAVHPDHQARVDELMGLRAAMYDRD